VLSADKVCEQFALVGEVDGADGAGDFAARRRQLLQRRTVQLRLVTYQRFAGRESLHADRTHKRRVRRLQTE